ncbi:MAG: hypothetical protein N3A63_03945 [Bacteroidetes bacterium]|nr:hypothetical protein [Bacteroidota bacterium]
MASNKKYQVIFTGQLEDGADPHEVKRRLAETFKTSIDRIEKLFTSAPTLINTNLDESAARSYVETLASIGVRCTMEPMPETFTLQSQPTQSQTKHPLYSAQLSKEHIVKGVLIASALTVLFVLYIFLILGIFQNFIFHIDQNTDWLEEFPNGLGIVVYCIVTIVYLCTLGALIKVFFWTPQKKQPSVTLSRKKEQTLFSFVEKLCTTLGVKPPTTVEVNLSTSITLEYKQGLLSFLEEQQTLVIGLSLLTHLTLAEFACVLANNFANYRSPFHTRIYFFIKSIIFFFHKAAYSNDSIDSRLLLSKNTASNIVTRLFFSCLLLFSSLVKKICILFLAIAHAISKRYVYKLEFEADKCAASITSHEIFEATLFKQYLSTHVQEEAFDTLRKERKPNDRALPNNFPELTVQLLRQKTDEDLKVLKAQFFSYSTKELLKPPPSERIQQAKKRPVKGGYTNDKPAQSIVTQYEEISRTLTLRLYKEQLTIQFSPQDLIPTSEYLNPPQSDDMILNDTTDRGFF